MELRTARIIPRTDSEGPGWRYCIWVQGCDLHCKGCANQSMLDFFGGYPLDTSEIISSVLAHKKEIEGVTFLGGEPICQVKAVSEIAKSVKTEGLSVVLFTGKIYEQLVFSHHPYIHLLLQNTDLLIDGPYIECQRDFSRPWVGSRNQRFLFLTDRYNHLKSSLAETKNKLQMRIMPNGRIWLNGMADLSRLAANDYVLSSETPNNIK